MAKTVTARVTSETTSTDVATGNGVVDADTQRVVLATDQPAVTVTGAVTTGGLTDTELRASAVPVSGTVSVSEPVSVDDNAGSLTVDAPTGAPVNVQIGDGTRQATVRDTGASDSLNVAIVDGSGNQVTSFGGGTQYTEGDTDASITGTAILWEDAGDTLRAVSSAKPLPVSGSFSATIGEISGDVAHDAADSGKPVKIGGYASDAPPTDVADGDRVNAWFAQNGAQAIAPTASAERYVDGTLGALNATIEIATTGAAAVIFVAKTAGTLIGDIWLEGSSDGGSTWAQMRPVHGGSAAALLDPGVAIVASDLYAGDYAFTWTINNSDDVYCTDYRLRVNAYTSGTVDFRAIALEHVAWNQDQITAIKLLGPYQTENATGYTNSPFALGVNGSALPMMGNIKHDATEQNVGGYPVLIGGRSSAAAPTDVSADNKRVRAWFLRNGAQATVLTAAGALIGGDATNGLDVDVTRTVAPTAGTSTLTNVSGSAASVTLLASNTGRKGATIWNDSTAILYVKFGTTASTTSCTVKMIADAYYEVPFGYTGRIDGIWASAAGAARITELT